MSKMWTAALVIAVIFGAATGRGRETGLAAFEGAGAAVKVILETGGLICLWSGVMELLRPGGVFLTLVKPQFEAAREDVGEGGVIRDPEVRLAALERVRRAFEEAGLVVRGWCESPITGHKGNVEYLLCGVLPA